MSERRCFRCGGLVGTDAEWCGQCFTRLVEPAGSGRGVSAQPAAEAPLPEAPAAEPPVSAAPERAVSSPEPVARDHASPGPTPEGPGAFRAAGEELRWVCPSCEMENPLEASECGRCGTEFRTLFETVERPSPESLAAARSRSLLFPGAGYGAFGRKAEGIARGITFGWMAAMAIALLVIRRGVGLGPFLPLVLLLAFSALVVYVLSAVDARRLAAGGSPVLSTRTLLFASATTMVVTVALVLIIAIRSRQAG